MTTNVVKYKKLTLIVIIITISTWKCQELLLFLILILILLITFVNVANNNGMTTMLIIIVINTTCCCIKKEHEIIANSFLFCLFIFMFISTGIKNKYFCFFFVFVCCHLLPSNVTMKMTRDFFCFSPIYCHFVVKLVKKKNTFWTTVKKIKIKYENKMIATVININLFVECFKMC